MSTPSHGWTEATDPKTGKTYYYNKQTKKTQWTKPAEMEEAASTPAAAAATEDPENVAANWAESTDPKSGRKYYYNRVTKKTSWKMPPCMGGEDTASTAAAAPAAASATTAAAPAAAPAAANDDPANVPANWREATDPSSGRKYYYNKVTKVTSWKKPACLDEDGGNAPAAAPAAPGAAAAAAPAAAAETPKKAFDEDFLPGKKKKLDSDDEDAEKKTMARKKLLDSDDDEKPKKKALDSDDDSDSGADSDADSDDEKGDDSAMKMKRAMHNREIGEARAKLEEEEDEEGDKFIFSKHRKGWLNRFLRLGDGHDEKLLLTFKKSMIRKALLKQNRDLDAEAVQLFKNIMSYMGDRKSSKKPTDHAKKMLKNLMLAPAGLRDEALFQLCKQTTENPRVESTVKGWELMMYCLATFPPSKGLKSFITDYLDKSAAEAAGTKPQIQVLAKSCKERLPLIVGLGQRRQVPSSLELDCLREGKPVPIRINLINGGFKTFNVEPYTLVQDVLDMCINKWSITVGAPFALYEAAPEPNVERILDPKDRILDVLAAWENRALLEKEEVKDDDKKKKGKDAPVLKKDPNYSTFLFKAKLVLKTTNKELMSDPEAVNLIYLQAISDVCTSRYPCNEKDVTVLAALQLQAQHGDFKKDVHVAGWLLPKLNEYMPRELLTAKKTKGSKSDKEWEQLILAKYSKVTGFTALEAKLNYLDYVQEWVFYGCTFFMVEQRQFKDYPSPLVMGINSEGVILMHPEKRTVLENYAYTDIVTWGHSDEKFIIVVGNIVQQRKLIFKTNDGKPMNHLIHDYVKFKVKTTAK